MGFRLERRRIKKGMVPGEEIVESDLVEDRHGRRAVLIATTHAAFVVAGADVLRLQYEHVRQAVRSGGGLVLRKVTLVADSGQQLEVFYDPRARTQPALDAIVARSRAEVVGVWR
jgi:hypothetical protein